MPIAIPQKIRTAIMHGDYDLTQHAIEEMAEDGLILADVETAILKGVLAKTETDDPRGVRYTMHGWSLDGHIEVGVVGRFTETGIFLIVTAYEVIESEE